MSSVAYAKKKIFILHSYAQEYSWTKQQHEGFTTYLKDNYKEPVEIVTEHLDTKRVLFDSAYKQFFLAYLQTKYVNYSVDVIYATDDNALNFLREYKYNIFSNSPIVFSGVNDLSIIDKLNKKLYAGVFETKEIKPNIDLIHTFSPQTKEIYFVGDNTSTYHSIESNIKSIKDEFKNLHFNFIADKSISHVTKTLKKLTLDRTFIVLTTIGGFVDDRGRNLTLQESISILTSFENLIFISMEDAYMFPNIVGGYVTSGKKQGKYAANIVQELFENKSVESIGFITKSPNIYLFDQQSLNKYRLALFADINNDVQLVNQNKNLYLQNYETILNILFLVFIIFSIALVIIYLVMREKNRRVIKSIQDIEGEKNSLIRKLSNNSLHEGHWDWDVSNNTFEFSQGFYELFELPRDKVITSYKECLELIPAEEVTLVDKFISDCLNNKKAGELEHRILLPNQRVKKVLHQVDSQKDRKGHLIHLIGAMHEITDI